MKNLLLIPAILLLLTACKKKYCWECKTTTLTVVTSPAHDTIRTFEGRHEEICDKSEDEINEYSADTSRFTRQIGDSIVSLKTFSDCSK